MMTIVNQTIMMNVEYVMVKERWYGLQIEMEMDWEIQRLLLEVVMNLQHLNNNNNNRESVTGHAQGNMSHKTGKADGSL